MGNTDKKDHPRRPLVAGVDFYIEKGMYVFTEAFLRERGYCCQSGCRHCPYGYQPTHPTKDEDRSGEREK